MFGGTFDPPHVGHLALAEWARERLVLDRVLFVPAGRPPHKRGPRLSSPEHRLAMTRLAVRGNAAFEVSTVELEEAGPSYTVETLERLGSGGSVPRGSCSWARTVSRIPHVAGSAGDSRARHAGRGATAARAPHAGDLMLPAGFTGRLLALGNPLFEVSSTLVRRRARAGRSIRYLVPESVVAYIARHRLYPPGR